MQYKDEILNKESFKGFGNCSEKDHRKLILHLLYCIRAQQVFSFPKVIDKADLQSVGRDKPGCIAYKNQGNSIGNELIHFID